MSAGGKAPSLSLNGGPRRGSGGTYIYIHISMSLLRSCSGPAEEIYQLNSRRRQKIWRLDIDLFNLFTGCTNIHFITDVAHSAPSNPWPAYANIQLVNFVNNPRTEPGVGQTIRSKSPQRRLSDSCSNLHRQAPQGQVPCTKEQSILKMLRCITDTKSFLLVRVPQMLICVA